MFTGAAATSNPYPYLYGSQSPGFSVANGGDLIIGSDFASSSLPTLANDDGLLLIDYTIAGGASGFFPLTFDVYGASNPVGTALFNGSNALIPTLRYENGSINIASASLSVPEPSSGVLSLLAVLGAGLIAYRHRKAKCRLAYCRVLTRS